MPGEVKQLVPLDITMETVMERMLHLDDTHAHHLATLIEVIRRDRGCTTPAEDFITGILSSYNARGLEPADVIGRLQEFSESFKEMIETTNNHLQRYPELLKMPAVEEGE